MNFFLAILHDEFFRKWFLEAQQHTRPNADIYTAQYEPLHNSEFPSSKLLSVHTRDLIQSSLSQFVREWDPAHL